MWQRKNEHHKQNYCHILKVPFSYWKNCIYFSIIFVIYETVCLVVSYNVRHGFSIFGRTSTKKNCNKNITLFKNTRNTEIATKFTASKSRKVLLPLPTVCICPFPYSTSSTQNKAIKKVVRQFQVRLVSSISSSRELISTRVCWTGNRGEGSETSSSATLIHWVCSWATEISSKRALYPRNTTTGRGMARAFPFAKYFHCVGSNRKEGKKKRKNYLASNFNCLVGKWGKKSIKKTYMSGM